MGFVMLNACFSDHKRGDTNIRFWFPTRPLVIQTFMGPLDRGGHDLVFSDKFFYGAKGVLSPFQRLPIFRTRLPGIVFDTAGHPSDILKPGDQGTQR